MKNPSYTKKGPGRRHDPNPKPLPKGEPRFLPDKLAKKAREGKI